jgi:uncharacterized membrane protein YidH (DUF202 family)
VRVQADMQTHGDPGLQPERTDLAWRRTGMSLVVAAAVFVRWMPHHGLFVGTLTVISVLAAWGITATRKRRLLRAIQGIRRENLLADTSSTASLAVSVVVLAALGIYTVLFLPLGP